MSREIEFRYWDKTFKNMKFYPDIYDSKLAGELMQYTGLKDKNGVKIFEGDILFRKDEDFSQDGTLFRGYQSYYQVVWHKGAVDIKDDHGVPVEIAGFALRTIPGRFVRKPQVHIELPQREVAGRTSTDPIVQEESYTNLVPDTKNLEVIGNIYEDEGLIK